MFEQPINVPFGERKYLLIEPYQFDIEVGGEHYVVRIPKGFINDGASVPRLFWSISGLTPDGLIRAAALVHDYLIVYKRGIPASHIINKTRQDALVVDGKTADRLFKKLMIDAGMNKRRALIAYYSVRIYSKLFR